MVSRAVDAIYSIVKKDNSATDVDNLSPNVNYVPLESPEITIETRSMCGDTNLLIDDKDKKKKSIKVSDASVNVSDGLFTKNQVIDASVLVKISVGCFSNSDKCFSKN